jgi:hypothetical protein
MGSNHRGIYPGELSSETGEALVLKLFKILLQITRFCEYWIESMSILRWKLMFDTTIREVYSVNQEVPEHAETPKKNRKNSIHLKMWWLCFPPLKNLHTKWKPSRRLLPEVNNPTFS